MKTVEHYMHQTSGPVASLAVNGCLYRNPCGARAAPAPLAGDAGVMSGHRHQVVGMLREDVCRVGTCVNMTRILASGAGLTMRHWWLPETAGLSMTRGSAL